MARRNKTPLEKYRKSLERLIIAMVVRENAGANATYNLRHRRREAARALHSNFHGVVDSSAKELTKALGGSVEYLGSNTYKLLGTSVKTPPCPVCAHPILPTDKWANAQVGGAVCLIHKTCLLKKGARTCR